MNFEMLRFFVLVFVVMSIFLGLLFIGLYLKNKKKSDCSSFDEHESACHNCASNKSGGCAL